MMEFALLPMIHDLERSTGIAHGVEQRAQAEIVGKLVEHGPLRCSPSQRSVRIELHNRVTCRTPATTRLPAPPKRAARSAHSNFGKAHSTPKVRLKCA